MRSIAFADFLIGVGILFVLEGLLFAAIPGWMRRRVAGRPLEPRSFRCGFENRRAVDIDPTHRRHTHGRQSAFDVRRDD